MVVGLKKPEGTAGAAWPAILVGLFVAFGGVLFGYVDNYEYSLFTRTMSDLLQL